MSCVFLFADLNQPVGLPTRVTSVYVAPEKEEERRGEKGGGPIDLLVTNLALVPERESG